MRRPPPSPRGWPATWRPPTICGWRRPRPGPARPGRSTPRAAARARTAPRGHPRPGPPGRASAVLLAAGVVGLALAHGMAAYLAAWVVVGIGMGVGLYDGAFATLGWLFGLGARRAIGSLTLFGGFASTVCWPLSAFLVAELGWRGTCLSYAAFQLAVALPIHLLLLPRVAPRPAPTMNAAEPSAATPVPRRVTPILVLLAAALTLSSTISAVVSVHLLSFLQAREVSAMTAVALRALVGPSQGGAPAIEILVARYHHPVWTKGAPPILVAPGLAALWDRLPLLSAAPVLFCAGVGLRTI